MENRYPETVTGYDCREMWLPNVESWSYLAKQSLLRSDIERRLTIGREGWNSVFVHHTTKVDGGWLGTAPGYTLAIPDEYRTSESFWDDDLAMSDFVRQHQDAFQQPFWAIAFSLVRTPKYERYLAEWLQTHRSHYVSIPLNVNPNEKSEWTFLGYDVQDSGPSFWEGLGGGVYPDDIHIPLREKWGKFLNKYHLFDDQLLATEFSDSQEEKEHHPYFAYGLYLMKTYP
jgi:hypothetical protein